MKILIVAALPDLGEPSDLAHGVLRDRLAASGSAAQVVLARDLDWDNLRAVEGGWEGAYGWAAKSHDALALVPTGPEVLGRGWPLSRGVFEMARTALVLGRRVVVCDGARGVVAVDQVVPAARGEGNWKRSFGFAQEEPPF